MPRPVVVPAAGFLLYTSRVQILNRIAEFAPSAPRKQREDSRITRIVVHHDAGANPPSDPLAVTKRLRSYWYQHKGLFPYHYAIDPTGTVHKCNPISSVLPHARGANWDGIGVMMLGYFHPPHNEVPTPAQLESLRLLIAELRRGLPSITAVVAHRDVQGSKTACPGNSGMVALRAANLLT